MKNSQLFLWSIECKGNFFNSQLKFLNTKVIIQIITADLHKIKLCLVTNDLNGNIIIAL